MPGWEFIQFKSPSLALPRKIQKYPSILITLPNPHDGNLWHGEHEAGRRWNRSGEDVFEGVRVICGGRDRGRPLVMSLVNVLINQTMVQESAIELWLLHALHIIIIIRTEVCCCLERNKQTCARGRT